MAIKIIAGYNDSEYDAYEKLFHDNFSPDDWDYIIIADSDDAFEVENIASKLAVCDYKAKKIGDKFYAVTYHS